MISNLAEEIKAVRTAHPSWSFQESWNFLETTRPALFAQSSAESNRIQAKLAPQLEREAYAKSAHVEVIARRLMARDSRLTFGRALEITRICLPRVQSEIEDLLRQPVKAVEPEPKGRTMLIRGSEGTYVE
jgi:hypothetical protein